jgi:hypothetical protein
MTRSHVDTSGTGVLLQAGSRCHFLPWKKRFVVWQWLQICP